MRTKTIFSAFILMIMVLLPVQGARAEEGQTIAYVAVYVSSAGCSPVLVSLPILQQYDPITQQIKVLYPSQVYLNGSAVGARMVTANGTHVNFYIKVNVTEPANLNYTVVYGSSIVGQDNSPSVFYGEIPLKLNNTGSALTNHVVMFTLNLTDLIAAGFVQPDARDIRFRDSAGNQLSYWFALSDTTDALTVYVKVPSIPNGNSYIYMQYFSPTATDGRSGDNTFLLFDDFLGTALDSGKWGTLGSGMVSVSGGELFCSSNYAGIWSSGSFSDAVVVARVKWVSGITQLMYRHTDTDNMYYVNLESATLKLYKRVSGTSTQLGSTLNIIMDTYEKMYAKARSTSHLAMLIGEGQITATDSAFSSGRVGIRVGGTVGSFYADYIAVMPAAAADPAVAPEQTFSASVQISCISQPQGAVTTQVNVTLIVPYNASAPLNVTWSPLQGNASDVVKFVAQYELGRYFLIVLPLIVLLATAAMHTGAIAAAATAGLCAYTNYALGYDFYATAALGWMAAVGVLLFVYEQRGGGGGG